MTASIKGHSGDIRPDDRDKEIMAALEVAYNQVEGPKVGDWIRFNDGSMERFSASWWEDGLQTSTGGSWYLGKGYASFSGGLNPSIPLAVIKPTNERAMAVFWFFHHGFAQAHSAVYVEFPVRVWETPLAPYR